MSCIAADSCSTQAHSKQVHADLSQCAACGADTAESCAQAANGRLERLAQGGASEAAEQELAAMRKMLRCSVCQERPKDAAVITCGHTFCTHCIRSTHASRNRRCPVCTKGFSMDNVKHIYLA